jgi:phage terminase large subunit-like protein
MINDIVNYSNTHNIECLSIVEEILDNLDERGIIELLGGNQSDIDSVLKSLVDDTYKVMFTGDTSIDFAPKYTERLSTSIEETLRCKNINYFITSLLPQFQMSWHHLEWGDLTMQHDKLCIIASRDHGKSYYFSNAYAIWQLYKYSRPKGVSSMRPGSAHSNRGYLFSFSLQQAVDLMEILKNTIESSAELSNRLLPDKRNEGAWASTNIVCKNGARMTCKGFGSSVRGAHPYWIIVDDGLKDNVIYSQLQREKSISYFQAVIMNMLVPGGQIIVVGTPFHEADLYGDLKKKNGWFVIEYPSIFPNGKILWPSRWSYNDLRGKKEDQGNIIFSRENLCRPITSEASIFPMDVLLESIKNMENYTLVNNRDDFPIKFSRVVTGCDFAISANVGADYSVFSTFGIDDRDHLWLLNMHRKSGQKYQEQMQTLRSINVRFRPDVMMLEQNAFQKIFFDEASREGMPVQGHTTGVEKNDLRTGWVHVSTLMSQGRIHIPVGDENSRNIKDLIFSDLGGIAFTPKGLENTQSHDDIGSSFWLASMARNIVVTGNKFMFL